MEQTTKSRRRRTQKRLQRAVLRRKITLETVADRMKLNIRTISEWVSGLRCPPSTKLEGLDKILADIKR